MGYKESDIKVYGRFWSETTDGKIIDANQIDGVDLNATLTEEEWIKNYTVNVTIGDIDVEIPRCYKSSDADPTTLGYKIYRYLKHDDQYITYKYVLGNSTKKLTVDNVKNLDIINEYGQLYADAVFASISGGNKSQSQSLATISYGSYATASGFGAKSFGIFSEASGDNSFAIGLSTRANTDNSFAGGFESEANGRYSFAFGQQVKTEANYSAAFGAKTRACATNSFVVGQNTVAGEGATASFVAGTGTRSSITAQAVVGRYNAQNDNALFIVGSGSSDTARANAFEVLSNGIKTDSIQPLTAGNELYLNGAVRTNIITPITDGAALYLNAEVNTNNNTIYASDIRLPFSGASKTSTVTEVNSKLNKSAISYDRETGVLTIDVR